MHTAEQDPASTVWVTKVRSDATPLVSVSAIPVTTPSASFRTTLVPETSSVVVVPPEVTSAVTVMSTSRIRENNPVPVTSTVEELISPSMKSIVDEPLMITSLVLFNSTSFSTKLVEPKDSIPTPFCTMDRPDNETSRFVFNPYFKAGP